MTSGDNNFLGILHGHGHVVKSPLRQNLNYWLQRLFS